MGTEFEEFLQFFRAPLLILHEEARAFTAICQNSEVVDCDTDLLLEELNGYLVSVNLALQFSQSSRVHFGLLKLVLFDEQAFVFGSESVPLFQEELYFLRNELSVVGLEVRALSVLDCFLQFIFFELGNLANELTFQRSR